MGPPGYQRGFDGSADLGPCFVPAQRLPLTSVERRWETFRTRGDPTLPGTSRVPRFLRGDQSGCDQGGRHFAHAAPICPTASANRLPAGTSRSRSSPVFTRRSSKANAARIGSACAANRDSQPRTVAAGRPAAVTRRQPHPLARANSAAQITPPHPPAGPVQSNSTRERPHPTTPEQIPAAAGSAALPPRPPARTAAPHDPTAPAPPQSGHANSPKPADLRPGKDPDLR
jgi:hypothetical protein